MPESGIDSVVGRHACVEIKEGLAPRWLCSTGRATGLTRKRALITASSQGIGLAPAQGLADAGAQPVLSGS